MVPYRVVAAASTNAALIVAGPVEYRGHYVSNTSDEFRYVHLYNKASAPGGGDIPLVTIGVPFESGANQEYSEGVEGFDLGLAIGISESPSTLVALDTANEVVATIYYSVD